MDNKPKDELKQDFKQKITEYAKNGGPMCTFIYLLSWIIFATLLYYKFGIAKSCALSYTFFFLSIGMVVLFSYEIADEINS